MLQRDYDVDDDAWASSLWVDGDCIHTQMGYNWGFWDFWRRYACLNLGSGVDDCLATGHCHPQARTITRHVSRQQHQLSCTALHLLAQPLTYCAVPPKASSCLQFKCHSLHGCIAELRVWSRALDSKEASWMFTRHTSAVLVPAPCGSS